MGNIAIANFLFQDNISSPSEGKILTVDGGAVTLMVQLIITGTATVSFEGTIGNSGIWFSIGDCLNKETLDVNSSTTLNGTNQLWEIPMDGFSGIRVNTTAISGTLTANGRSVN